MVEGIVKHLKKGDVALKTQCANALFKVRNLNLNHRGNSATLSKYNQKDDLEKGLRNLLLPS